MIGLIYFRILEKMWLPKVLKQRVLPESNVCIVEDWKDNFDADDIVTWYAAWEGHDWIGDFWLDLPVMKELRGLMLEQRNWKGWWRLKLVELIGYFKPIKVMYRVEFDEDGDDYGAVDNDAQFDTVDISAVILASREQTECS